MNRFTDDLKEWNIEISDEQIEMFDKYTSLLLEWNEKINLTAITDINDIYKKHYLDSVSLIKCDIRINDDYSLIDYLYNASSDMSNKSDISFDNLSLLDLGTGAGFPGIPLKIMFPSLNITLADSLNKRIDFLNLVIEELGLKDIKAIHARAEDLAHDEEYREQYDLVVSRAVANLSVLSEYCIPFVKQGGYFIPYKSGNSSEEITSAKNAIGMLGGKLIKSFDFVLPDTDYSRTNICIRKIKSTEDRFPRKAGTPSKKPL